MFRGSHEQSVDDKGRVPFPARFREVLATQGQNTLVLIRWFDPCVRIYPLSAWEKVEEKLGQMPQFDPAVQRMRRLLTGECAEAELDKQGRILLPPRLRTYGGIGKDALFVGTMQMVELWDPTVWRKAQDELYADPNLVQQAAANFGL